MTVGKYCNREVVIAEPETTITEVAQLMRQHHVGDLVIVEKEGENNKPVGVITDRDLVVEVLAKEVSPASIAVKDIMSTDLTSITEDESLFDALERMRRHGIRRLPVINNQGGLEGILCADDVIEMISEATNDLVKLISREKGREEQECL